MTGRYLATPLRRALNKTIREAREVAEQGAADAARRLGVADPKAPAHLDEAARSLRRRLRAHARALGDAFDRVTDKQETRRLVETAAYAHWHRMLFARFLAERGLLRHPQHGVPVSLHDCRELDQKDGVNIMKGYMESGEFSRGRESIRAEGSIVLVGNFDVDVAHQQRVGHLFGPLPPEMRNDTAFMDRIHAYLPGWDMPKVSKDLFTDQFGLVSDVLAECFSRLRAQSRINVLQGRVRLGGALSGRDQNAVNKTVSGLLKLLYPDAAQPVPDEDLEWALRLALEVRRRVKEQQKRIGSAEFRNTQFSYVMGLDGIEKFVATPELQSEDSIGPDPLPAGQVWAISPGGQDEASGLFRIEVTESPGGGVRILNQSPPNPFRESVRIAEQNLYSRAHELVGDRNPREHEFAVQLRSFDAARSGAELGVGVLVSLCSALLGKPLKGGLAITGGVTLGGSIEPIHNPIDVVELAMEKGAVAVLMPVSCRRALIDLSDDVATKVQVLFYADATDALRKAVHE